MCRMKPPGVGRGCCDRVRLPHRLRAWPNTLAQTRSDGEGSFSAGGRVFPGKPCIADSVAHAKCQ